MKKQKKQKKMKLPKTVQQSIPYTTVYSDEGIIEIEPGKFTRSYRLHDINYSVAKQKEQEEMFVRYSQLLNMFDPNVRVEITINNHHIDHANFQRDVLLSPKNDGLDDLREEENKMLLNKIQEGKNNLVSEKYLTVCLEAENAAQAAAQFARMDGEIVSNVRRVGKGSCDLLTITERLEVLHNIYNIGKENEFGAKTILDELERPEFNFTNMRRLGLTTKDVIGPESMEFKGNYFKLGEKYGRAMFLSALPAQLSDAFLPELTDIGCSMLTSLHFQGLPQDKALRLTKNQMISVNSNMVDAQKRAAKSGYSAELISADLRRNQSEVNEMLEDLIERNQKMFFLTMVVTHFADTLEELEKNTETIRTIARKYLVTMSVLSFQQEDGLNAALPLCYNKLSARRTLTTESAAIFMPFSTQELTQKNGLYYGINAVSRNLILFNRKNSRNGNGFVLGTPGAGKSFSSKMEMMNVLLSTSDDVIVLDPEREYTPLVGLLNRHSTDNNNLASVVRIAAGGKDYLNPMDLDFEYGGDDDPLVLKLDFILGLIQNMYSTRYPLPQGAESIIDRCMRQVYEPYLTTVRENRPNGEFIPTLADLQKCIAAQPDGISHEIALAMEVYTTGSLNLFAQPTNVIDDGRFTVYDIKDVGKQLKSIAMLIVMDAVWNRLMRNRRRGVRTWIYIDEIYLLFANENSAEFLKMLFKRARKYGGLPTGLTQNVEDLLMSDTARSMLSNSDYIMMLNQATLDRTSLAALLNISETQMGYIDNVDPGCGLLYTSKSMVPLINKFPKDTELYRAMTTNMSDLTDEELAKMAMDDIRQS